MSGGALWCRGGGEGKHHKHKIIQGIWQGQDENPVLVAAKRNLSSALYILCQYAGTFFEKFAGQVRVGGEGGGWRGDPGQSNGVQDQGSGGKKGKRVYLSHARNIQEHQQGTTSFAMFVNRPSL